MNIIYKYQRLRICEIKCFKILYWFVNLMIFGIKVGTRKIDKACQVVIGVLCVIIHSVPAVMTLNMCNTVLSDVEKDLKYILSIFCILSLILSLPLFYIFRNIQNVLSFWILSFIQKFNS